MYCQSFHNNYFPLHQTLIQKDHHEGICASFILAKTYT